MLVFDDIKVEFESQGFKGTHLGASPQKDKTVMFLESVRSTDTVHAIFQISTGKLEGFNNKIKVAKRIAYGYRDDAFFFTLIRYLSLPRSLLHGNP